MSTGATTKLQSFTNWVAQWQPKSHPWMPLSFESAAWVEGDAVGLLSRGAAPVTIHRKGLSCDLIC